MLYKCLQAHEKTLNKSLIPEAYAEKMANTKCWQAYGAVGTQAFLMGV